MTSQDLASHAFSVAISPQENASTWIDGKTPRERADAIVSKIARRYGLTLEDLKGSELRRDVSQPRQHAMWSIRRIFGWSLPQIGRYFGRDHTTILHGIRQHEARISS